MHKIILILSSVYSHAIHELLTEIGDKIMSKLDTKERKAIPKSEFGLPGSRKYPMPDRAHAINAKARATQMVKAGKLSEDSKAQIDAKANRLLGKGRG